MTVQIHYGMSHGAVHVDRERPRLDLCLCGALRNCGWPARFLAPYHPDLVLYHPDLVLYHPDLVLYHPDLVLYHPDLVLDALFYFQTHLKVRRTPQ